MPKVSDEHRAARREQIIIAAAACVSREGFHKTTMADVIREAGLSAGAVYGYFKGKNEIISALADRAVGEVNRLLAQLMNAAGPVEPTDALLIALERLVAMSERPGGDLSRVGVQAWGEALRDPGVHAIVADQMRSLRDVLEALVRRGQDGGVVPATTDPAATAQALFGLVPGFVVQRLILGDITPASYVDGVRGLTA